MTRLLLLLGLLASSVYAGEIDHARLLDCIIVVEHNRWDRPGGALGWTRATWEETTTLPYVYAMNRSASLGIAHLRLSNLTRWMVEAHVDPTVYNLAMAWKEGLDGAIERARHGRRSDYAQRVLNLYLDRDFPR